jgi:uracil-DNA glycosylase family 4
MPPIPKRTPPVPRRIALATTYRDHIAPWVGCTRCVLSQTRARLVYPRGDVPADVVFVGEAPGDSEDKLGKPFIGPAGHMLDYIIKGALNGRTFRMAFTNTVMCIPKDEEGNKIKNRSDPVPKESVAACKPRVEDFIRLCRPKLVVAVGSFSAKWFLTGPKNRYQLPAGVRFAEMIHPAAILYGHPTSQGLEIQRATLKLEAAFDSMSDPTKPAQWMAPEDFDSDNVPF